MLSRHHSDTLHVARSSLAQVFDTLQEDLEDIGIAQVRQARERLMREAATDLAGLASDPKFENDQFISKARVAELRRALGQALSQRRATPTRHASSTT
jgi:hypothetical protein